MYNPDVVVGKLSPSWMVVVRFTESEATAQGTVDEEKEVPGSYHPIIRTNAKSNPVLESKTGTKVRPIILPSCMR